MNWLRTRFARRRMTADLAEELQQHLDEKVDALVAQGMPREEALHAARRAFGNATLLEERSREVWMWPWAENLSRDIRFALRQLRRSPGFTITAILILALGIGANTAMFTVVNAVLLRPLPYADAGRLVTLRRLRASGHPYLFGLLYPDIAEWQARARSFRAITYYTETSPFIKGASGTEPAHNISSGPNLFAVLGVQPALGRTYTKNEQIPGHDKVVVLDDALWEKLFHRDPHVPGKIVKLDDVPYTVIGVMPKGFSYPFSQTNEQVWTPVALAANVLERKGPIPSFSVIAGLKPGVSLLQAQKELDDLQHGIVKKYPAAYVYPRPTTVQLETYRSNLVRDFRATLWILQIACGLLWLIACANVASLMLVRGTVQQRQIAVRQALGASKRSLVWVSLLDSMLLSLGGAIVGIGVALAILRIFHAALIQRIDILRDIHLNITVLIVLAVFSIVTAVLFGGVPAWLNARAPVTQVLQHGSQQSGTAKYQNRMRDTLMVVEIALSLALLVACGLLLQTLYSLRRVPLGIHTEHVITADLTIPGYRYLGGDIVRDLDQPLLQKAQHLPDVMAASLSTNVPLDRSFFVQLSLAGDANQARSRSNSPKVLINAQLGAASWEMQRVFGFRMLQGRFFNAQDTATSQPVVIVNQAFADEWSPESSPLRKKFLNVQANGKNSRAIIVGVIDDLPQRSLADKRGPQVLFCIAQIGPGTSFYQPVLGVHMALSARTRENPAGVIPEMRAVLQQTAPELRGTKIETMGQVVEDSLGDQKLAAHLLEIFGGTALLITLTGLYGSLLYMVSLRKRELAIRLALGAQRSQIMRLIATQAATLLAVGLGLGIALSLATARFVRGYLYGVPAHDPWTMLTVSLLFAACAALAAYIPARRASRVDPMQALRAE